MAAEVLQSISRDEAERLRLMSEEKNQLDLQSEFVYARREGRLEERKELLDLLDKGHTPEEIRKMLASR